MTLFVTSDAVDQLSVLGDGQLAVYFNSQEDLVCAGSTLFEGGQTQIPAQGDDNTTPEKDGFVLGDSIVWKFQDTSGNQYDIYPTPFDTYTMNDVSVITSISFTPIDCATDTFVCADDGVTQADLDAVQALLDIANENLANALANQEDGVTQADVDAVQELLDLANAEITDLNAQLENTSSNNTGGDDSCAPIYVELLEGWNIIGYTLSYPQDVTATMASIVDDLQIVKNNAAKVYWPDYGFNGIGDFIPGQGYQIRMSNAITGYTFPDVGGMRVELQPTVPEWVYDLPILNHPNDTRSLVKVVNMLGREVDPSSQFSGEVLLYLYSDGTTEKRLKK